MVDEELVLGVDGDLDVVAHVGDPAAADRHGTTIGGGEGDLRLASLFHAPQQALVLLHAFLEQLDLLFELLGGELALFGFLGVVSV